MAKAILSCLALALLCGCASNYNPYVEEISSHGQVVHTSDYYYDFDDEITYVTVSPYYPWGSLDYFYFGNHYYRYASTPAFAIGVSYWSPWYSPWYGPFYNPYYYAAWYPGFYPWSYAYFGYGYGWGWYGRGHPYGRYGYYDHGHGHDGHGRGQRTGVPVANRGPFQKQGNYQAAEEPNFQEREAFTRTRGWRTADQREAAVRQVSSAPAGPVVAPRTGASSPVTPGRAGTQPRFSPPPATTPSQPVAIPSSPAAVSRSGPARFRAPASRSSYSGPGSSASDPGRPDRDRP